MSIFGVILVRIREIADQNNTEYGHFLHSEIQLYLMIVFRKVFQISPVNSIVVFLAY